VEIKGKIAIVTGAGSGGSGRATAQRLARDGASVVVSDIAERGGRETVSRIEAQGGRAAFFRADVGVEAEIRALIAFAEKTYSGLDIMVNSAGPYHPELLGHWPETVQANLLGTMYGTLYAIEAMRRRGGGAIVNFGSTSALGYGWKHSPSPAYDSAKAAVMHLTATLAGLREREGIRVNCIVPDWVATEEVKSYWEALSPQQRKERGAPDVLITLDEIADAVVQLATDESLAGRVMVCWCGQPRCFIPFGDPGYSRLE
jgi:NAD(P)-dependent dehydrogenase (short-subunit alcohol dehydrogenase family)